MEWNKLIDHTLLKPESTQAQIEKLCEEALQYDFASVCVNPCWIEVAKKKLQGSTVKVCCVIGFPLGAMTTEAKVLEAQDAVAKGAEEVDMVLNIGWLKEGKDEAVTQEIAAIKEAVGSHILKVILETCLLSEDEIVRACQDAVHAKADFVKTSTGFNAHGATVEAVALMKKTVGNHAQVKAAGGVRSFEDLKAMVDAGATRIGTSGGVKLMEEAKNAQ